VNDPISGVISQMEGETLETYCNSDRCKFYHTKPGTIPDEYMALLDGAITLRQERLAGNSPRKTKIKFWKYRAYILAEYARALVTAENREKQEAEWQTDSANNQATGKHMEAVTNTVEQQMKRSDSGAFSMLLDGDETDEIEE
jgi:hypothetical protein